MAHGAGGGHDDDEYARFFGRAPQNSPRIVQRRIEGSHGGKRRDCNMKFDEGNAGTVGLTSETWAILVLTQGAASTIQRLPVKAHVWGRYRGCPSKLARRLAVLLRRRRLRRCWFREHGPQHGGRSRHMPRARRCRSTDLSPSGAGSHYSRRRTGHRRLRLIGADRDKAPEASSARQHDATAARVHSIMLEIEAAHGNKGERPSLLSKSFLAVGDSEARTQCRSRAVRLPRGGGGGGGVKTLHMPIRTSMAARTA